MKTIEGEFYVNLYKFSWQVIKPLIENKQGLIIATNCVSLSAGISFNCLRELKNNLEIIYYEENTNLNLEKNKLVILLTNSEEKLKGKSKVSFFFKYIGEESNILTC